MTTSTANAGWVCPSCNKLIPYGKYHSCNGNIYTVKGLTKDDGVEDLINALNKKIALLREALLSLPEWHYLGYCSFCHEKKQDGHDIDCLRQRALEATK